MKYLALAVALAFAVTVPETAEAAPSTFAEVKATLGRACDRRLIRELRSWDLSFDMNRNAGRMRWEGPGGSAVVCGPNDKVVRIELANGWPLPADLTWKDGWKKAGKKISNRGVTDRSWKDENGKHIMAAVDGVKIGMHWAKKGKVQRVAVERR